MADKNSKVSENVDEAYYVDDTCTACELCVSDAPDNFGMTDDLPPRWPTTYYP